MFWVNAVRKYSVPTNVKRSLSRRERLIGLFIFIARWLHGYVPVSKEAVAGEVKLPAA
jgi:hypothetical protein